MLETIVILCRVCVTVDANSSHMLVYLAATMGTITTNLSTLRKEIPDDVTLVAVSKTKPVEALMEAYGAGQRIFGENRVQELVAKAEELPSDIAWHMIGHLQSNKVKYMAPFVNCIQSVHHVKLLEVINREAAKHDRIIKVLLQFHIAQETTKSGLTLNEIEEYLNSNGHLDLKNIEIAGVMGMATFTEAENQIRQEFRDLKAIFETLKTRYFPNVQTFKEISMGMSSDHAIAIQEGSTMVRVGSSIFGDR